MDMHKNLKHLSVNIIIVFIFLLTAVISCSSGAFAVSVPAASGQVNSYDGAILREKASVSSASLCVLSDNTKIKIHKEVFRSKTSTVKSKKWYYVTANGQKGYIRSDLVDNIKYVSVSGKTTDAVNYRSGAGTHMPLSGTFSNGTRLTIVLKANPVASTKGSSSTWYKVRYGGKYRYLCSSWVKLIESTATTSASPTVSAAPVTSTASDASAATDTEFEKIFKKQGFPASYRKKLLKLHAKHPNWGFAAYKTNISWSDALAKQCKGGTSLVSGVFPARYRDGSRQYEKGWYKANSQVVAYYMDPRNFLNDNSIYMFEDLTYNPKYQTSSVVKTVLAPSKLPACGFTAGIFVKAGKANNVSPVFLASRARQETGSGGAAVNGTKVLGKKVYNPFNIGAFGGTNPLYNGLVYAYGKGWTTPAKSVKGGAAVLAKNYISQGQNTGYYQRFNVRNGAGKAGTHQYMTNIMAPFSEASSTRNSYLKYKITDKPLVFEIPIYKGMPSSTKLP